MLALSHLWLLKALREASDELARELWGLPESAVCWCPGEGAWCLKEIVAHLREAEARFHEQLRRIASERDPRLPAEPLDLLPADQDCTTADLAEMLGELTELRDRTLLLLAALDASGWERTGRHPFLGRRSIAQIARALSEHDLEHLWQVRRLKEGLARGGTGAPRGGGWL